LWHFFYTKALWNYNKIVYYKDTKIISNSKFAGKTMKKTLLMITIVLLLVTMPCFAETPTIGKRIISMVEHSLYSGTSGAVACVTGFLGYAAFLHRNGQLPEHRVLEVFQEPGLDLIKAIANNTHGPAIVLGASGVLGTIALYNAYSVVWNFFGMIKDRV